MIDPDDVVVQREDSTQDLLMDTARTIADAYRDALDVFDNLTMRLARGEPIAHAELIRLRVEAACTRSVLHALNVVLQERPADLVDWRAISGSRGGVPPHVM